MVGGEPLWLDVALWFLVGVAQAWVVGRLVAMVPALRPRAWLWPLLVVGGPLVLACLVVVAVPVAVALGVGL